MAKYRLTDKSRVKVFAGTTPRFTFTLRWPDIDDIGEEPGEPIDLTGAVVTLRAKYEIDDVSFVINLACTNGAVLTAGKCTAQPTIPDDPDFNLMVADLHVTWSAGPHNGRELIAAQWQFMILRGVG